MKNLRVLLLTVALSVVGVTSLSAYSFTAWGTSTGEKVLAINPMVYFPTTSPLAGAMDTTFAYGLTPALDVYADLASLNLAPNLAYNASWIMPRYDLGGNNILALQVGLFNGGGYFLAPQYHWFAENDLMALEFNASATFFSSGFSTPTLGAVIAPVYKLVKDTLYVYAEIDPLYTVGTGYAVNIVPGLWIGIPQTPFQASIGVPLSNVLATGNPALSVGVEAWFWYTIPLK